MKKTLQIKTWAVAIMATIYLSGFAQQTIIDFQDLNLDADSYWNGSDMSGHFSSSLATFTNNFVDWGGGVISWEGFSYSNMTDLENQDFSNLYSSNANKVFEGNIFAVSYLSSDWTSYELIPEYISFSKTVYPQSIKITNSAYAALTIKNGDMFTKKFGGDDGNDPDWFLLKIFGVKNGTTTDTVKFYLADYRFSDNNDDYIINEWVNVDLTIFGAVDSIGFMLASSDVGDFGMNTPKTFCFDDIVVLETLSASLVSANNKPMFYPNPAQNTIFFNNNVSEFTIYDLSGREIIKGAESADISFLKTGTYIISLKIGNTYYRDILLKE